VAHFFADLVREACRDTGAGALALAGPLAGHRGFAGTVPAGATFHYAIAGVTHPQEWETGIGRIDAGGRLERTSIAASSAGGAAVAFAEGLKTVALTVGASWYAAADAPVTLGDVAGLQAALDGKQPLSTGHAPVSTVDAADQITVRRGAGWVNAPGSAIVRVNASGRVGIGTASPAQTLEVAGTGMRLTGTGSPALELQYSGSPMREGLLAIDPAGNLALRCLSAGGVFFDSFNGTVTFRSWSSGASNVFAFSPTALTPGTDNAQTLGAASLRFSTLFAASGTISTSDRALKKHVGRVPDAWLDAWGDVGWRRYRFRKGRRWHVGLIAQEVAAAFAARGADAAQIGLLCCDRMDDGSERWGLRYDECLAMEAAWVRRELARLRKGAAR
jgi:hypothetical protein